LLAHRIGHLSSVHRVPIGKLDRRQSSTTITNRSQQDFDDKAATLKFTYSADVSLTAPMEIFAPVAWLGETPCVSIRSGSRDIAWKFADRGNGRWAISVDEPGDITVVMQRCR
jgi:hypothetical protein